MLQVIRIGEERKTSKTMIYTLLLSAETQLEVSDIYNAYKDIIDCNRFLLRAVHDARVRIARVNKERKKSWLTYQMN